MSFKEMVAADNLRTFLDTGFYAEEHDIRRDGELYEAVPCVISQMKEQDRATTMSDHAQGLYRVSTIFHCRQSDIGGETPEKGRKFSICEDGFWREFYIAQSSCDMGMVRLELEAVDE